VRAEGITVHGTGTVVVVQGPRFSTRAGSSWYGQLGWDVINMTQYPEACLARELGICNAAIAFITDYDVGVEGIDGGLDKIEPVTQEQVFSVFDQNLDRVRSLLFRAIRTIPTERACLCATGPNAMTPPPPAGPLD
jgi:5'-methylthioadenosine phosphorylase